MKKFVFSLQKILDLRLFEQQQAEIELGKINAQIALCQNRLDEIARSRVRVMQSGSGVQELAFFAASQNYYRLLDQQKEACLAEMAELEAVAEVRREAVREAMRLVKVLEKVKETKYRDWKEAAGQAEEIARDDVVTSRYGR